MLPHTIHKPLLILSGLVASGVVLYGCAHFINSIWYEHSIPRDLHDARWEGYFSSTKYPTSGRLLARLPDPIPRDEEFEFELMLYYNIWSLFLTGKTARASFVGYLSSKSSTSSGVESRASVIPRQLSFRLKGGSTGFPEDITYTAIPDAEDQFIAGAYSAQRALDVGYFSLQKQ